MPSMIKVEGVAAILSNLKKVKGKQLTAMERGLKKAGLFLQRESQKVVPVDTGNLKNSAFTRLNKGILGSSVGSEVIVGYTAEYAIYVHENLQASHKPGKIAKFLEKPAKDNKDKLKQIIAEEMGK